MKKYSLLIATLVLFCNITHAGGEYINVSVVSIAFDKEFNEFSLIIKPSKKTLKVFQYSYDGCNEVRIYGSFDKQRWKNYKRPMSTDTHKQSLIILKSAMHNRKTINVGSFGSGYKKTSTCNYKSRGLFYEGNENYGFSVYSVDGRI